MGQAIELVVASFAKINWVLKVLGKREDGYHELRTIYQTIDLQDEIALEPVADPVIRLRVQGREVAQGEDNLVYRAASLLRSTAAVKQGVRIRLKKRIPVGSGLGGGSSNAAVALLALNKLWECGLSKKRLTHLAARLGSDVPFFLVGGTALGLERGEKVVPLFDRLQEQSLLLFYPDLRLSTREVFSLGHWQNYAEERMLTTEDLDTTMQRLHETVNQKTEDWSFLKNDFEDVLFERYPVLAEVQQRLTEAGCKKVMLCGSGSTLLGLGGIRQARRAVQPILQGTRGEIFSCRTLSRERYAKLLNQSVNLI